MSKKILLISPEGWGNNFVSKHHYANYLSDDHEVYFLNPAHSFSKIPLNSMSIQQKTIKDGLKVINYVNLLPRLNLLSKGIQRRIYKKQAQQIHKALNISKFDVIWSFDPYRYWNLKGFNADHYIYHTVDFHPKAKFEFEICQSADLLVGVTDLVNQETPVGNKIIHKVGHGADIRGFQNEEDVKIPGVNPIKACYIGNFHNHINYELLLQLVEQNHDVDFIMIGPTLDSNLSQGNIIKQEQLKKLSEQDNLHFIGSVHPTQLMSYMKQMDINLILFKKEFEKIHCSPHKVLGYFYSGNITLSNYIDEHKSTDSDIIRMVKTETELVRKFQKIKSEIKVLNKEEMAQKRREFALNNSYENKIAEIWTLLDKGKNSHAI